jgi:hypothetical protein
MKNPKRAFSLGHDLYTSSTLKIVFFSMSITTNDFKSTNGHSKKSQPFLWTDLLAAECQRKTDRGASYLDDERCVKQVNSACTGITLESLK